MLNSNKCLLVKSFFLLLPVLMLLVIACSDDNRPPVVSKTPDSITAINGNLYKAVMGTDSVDAPLSFLVVDKSGDTLPDQWVYFSRIVGDGTFVNDSLKTDSTGTVVAKYVFDGSMGHAEIMAKVKNVDSVTVSVRASTLIPGINGQGQYVLFNDRYKDVKNYNGAPSRIDVDPFAWILYAVYEQALGVVVVIDDVNKDSVVVDSADVFGVIVNTVYEGKTADSIGIGSTLSDVRTAFGLPDSVLSDTSPPPAWRIKYLAEGLTFYGDLTTDTVIFEIHLSENITSPALLKSNNNIGFHFRKQVVGQVFFKPVRIDSCFRRKDK